MIIIAEGIDKNGKSRLLSDLGNKIDLRTGMCSYHFKIPPTRNLYSFFRNWLDNFKEAYFKYHYKEFVVLDRFFYSTAVYEPIFRNNCSLRFKDLYFLERKLASIDKVVIIHCQIPVEKNWELLQQDKNEPQIKTLEQLNLLRSRMDLILGLSQFVVFKYDFTNITFEDFWANQLSPYLNNFFFKLN